MSTYKMTKNKKGFGSKSSDKNTNNLEVSRKPSLNPEFVNSEFKNEFLSAYKSKNSFVKEGIVKLYDEPFQCCEMYNFINNNEVMHDMLKELKEIHFYKKNNDLYKFKQSNDFKKLKLPYAQAIRNFLLEDFRTWVSECTGIELLSMIDLTSSEYSYTDILLCHDDELDSRRIAFTLYFVDPSWSEQDGGSLDLFGCDDNYEPTQVMRSIHPTWNKLAWFEVSEYSHHQVSEVLSKDKSRLSIHGWFHSKPVPRPVRFVEPEPRVMTFVEVEESVIRDWINPLYLERVTHASIKLKFERKSEIELPNFFKKEKYDALVDAFKSKDLQWKLRNPPNKRRFQSLDLNLEGETSTELPPSTGEETIRQCLQILASEAMFLILSNMTGLRFHKLIPKSNDDDDNDDDDDEEEDDDYEDENEEEVEGDGAMMEEGNDDGDDVSCHLHDEDVKEEVENDSKRKRSPSGDENNEDGPSAAEVQPLSKKLKMEGDDNDAQPSTSETNMEPCDAKCCYEVRKWSHGSYATANHKILSTAALDAVMMFNIDDWKSQYGGFTSYIAKDEDHELLTIEPKKNSLNLVYREQEVLSFVKHINHKVKSVADECNQSFFDVSFSYFE